MTKNNSIQNLNTTTGGGEFSEDDTCLEKDVLLQLKPSDELKPIHLSTRQKQMLDAIVKGMRYKEIAFQYGISENTVAFHISKLKERLRCDSSREIISSAIINGLVSLDR